MRDVPKPPKLRASKLRFREDEYVVVSFEVPVFEAPKGLTRAERAVAVAFASGDSAFAIARARKCSLHTVSNQIRSVYAKLGVHSRFELERALVRPRT